MGEEEQEIEPGRNQLGRFTKGNKFKPDTAVKPKQPDLTPLLQQLDINFPPERIIRILNEIFAASGNLKVKLEAIKYMNDLRYGKPVARNVTATLDAREFAQMFVDRGQDEGEGGSGDVDGEWEVVDEDERSDE